MGWQGYRQLGRAGPEHVPTPVDRYLLDEAAVDVLIDHVLCAVWCSIFVTSEYRSLKCSH
jgi:hypothetical protein